LAQDRSYQLTKTLFFADAEGNMQQVERAKRVRCWWTTKADGNVQLTIRYGRKPLELTKGKNAVELAGESELFGTLEWIRAALE